MNPTTGNGVPEFRVFPYENATLEPFETAVAALNPLVAVKVRSAAVHAALADVCVLSFQSHRYAPPFPPDTLSFAFSFTRSRSLPRGTTILPHTKTFTFIWDVIILVSFGLFVSARRAA